MGDDDGTEDYFDNGDFDANIEGSGNHGIEQGNLLKSTDNKTVKQNNFNLFTLYICVLFSVTHIKKMVPNCNKIIDSHLLIKKI